MNSLHEVHLECVLLAVQTLILLWKKGYFPTQTRKIVHSSKAESQLTARRFTSQGQEERCCPA
jgi:hypothetical protein